MINGEKFSPAAMESVLRSDPLVEEALVVGANQASSAALVFLTNEMETDRTELLKSLSETLIKVNISAPTYAQLYPDMIRFMTDISKLPRTSKGTVRRPIAEQVFATEINSLYHSTSSTNTKSISGSDLEDFLMEAVEKVTSQKVHRRDDLFSLGFDSLKASRLRLKIIQNIQFTKGEPGSNIVFEYPTIEK